MRYHRRELLVAEGSDARNLPGAISVTLPTVLQLVANAEKFVAASNVNDARGVLVNAKRNSVFVTAAERSRRKRVGPEQSTRHAVAPSCNRKSPIRNRKSETLPFFEISM